MEKKRYRLLLFDAIGRRVGLRLGLILLCLVGMALVDQYRPFLNNYRPIIWGAALFFGSGLLYFIIWMRRTSVIVYKDYLLVQGLLYGINIPFDLLVSITPTRLSREYPLEAISTSEWRRWSNLYEEPCARFTLRKSPLSMWAQRLLFPKFLFTADRLGIILHVPDWVSLSKTVETARSSWREQHPERTAASGKAELETIIFEDELLAADDHPTVLVIEENASQWQRLKQLLENHFQLIPVTSGIEGLYNARQYLPDLIIMHPNPPQMTGTAFLASLRKNKSLKDTPVIVLALKEERATCMDMLEAGANDYLFLPFTNQELQFRLNNWLKLRARERELHSLNDLLHQKTLNQMAELVRRGELLHFLPTMVAQQIMSGQISGKSEPFKRQKVTVLFIDIVSFTDLTSRLKPIVLSELLNEYLREMTAVANQYNGTVDKFIGDAVMVLFGAPQEKDEAEQAWEAAQAAVKMIQTVEELSMIWESRLPRPLQVRIGFNTGPCTAGVFGNEMLRSYTVVGSAVNIAARLQTAALPGTIVCSYESFQYTQEKVLFRELGALSLKGVSHPVQAFQILNLAAPS